METLTVEYQFSHGKRPRGFGAWWLKLTGTDNEGRYTEESYQITDALAAAKTRAVKRMKEEVGGVKKVVRIEVLP